MTTTPLIRCNKITKKYYENVVLSDFDLEIYKGEILGIKGVSGSGKTTLLNILGLLDVPNQGTLEIYGVTNPKPFSRKAEKIIRNHIAYLWQNFGLLDDENIENNLKIAMHYSKKVDKKSEIEKVLSVVGMDDSQKKRIYQCSGGEQQRIAIARLLLKPCELVLCDEPTGSLDAQNRKIVLDLLLHLRDIGKTIVIVSHDPETLNICDRIIELRKNG